MRISSKSRYATIALLDIAARPEDFPVTLADISKNQDISVSYLEQIFAKLRRTGLVTAARGPGGGYKLSRPAESISIAEIIDVFAGHEDTSENPMSIEEEKSSDAKEMWRRLSSDMHEYLSGVTLAQFINHPAALVGHQEAVN
jgi:Rrf2 family iron-sulfur cluster assembly transcriptional regulator